MQAARNNVLLAVPAFLYAINNYLKFTMQLYFNPATVKMLSNLKVLVIAVLLKIVMKRRFSIIQELAATVNKLFTGHIRRYRRSTTVPGRRHWVRTGGGSSDGYWVSPVPRLTGNWGVVSPGRRENEELGRSERAQGRRRCTSKNSNASVNAVTTRSGKVVDGPSPTVVDEEEPVDEEIKLETPDGRVHPSLRPTSTSPVSRSQEVKKTMKWELARARRQDKFTERPITIDDLKNVPFPQFLIKQKNEQEFSQFLDILKQLRITLPFTIVLNKMPKYAKFLKEMLNNKKKLEAVSDITLDTNCLTVVQNKLPEKLNDHGTFTIPCIFGSSSVTHALADLGRPFLRTARALVDVFEGTITLRVEEESVKFKVGGSGDKKILNESIYMLESFKSCVDRCIGFVTRKELMVGNTLIEGENESVIEPTNWEVQEDLKNLDD
ncbi:hypothetical protein SSX86_024085 [Deinandra increscens subsp. villosa]|uniref:Uncharacterized protein n=1 Tax=Deinandra increscens subsp. villosa TaxID=3103831 RepID=A0AAP0CMR4_9ASTR